MKHVKFITDTLKVSQTLDKYSFGRMGLVDPQSLESYIVPMNFCLHVSQESDDAKMKIYIHGRGTGKKINILKKNPKVTFQVDLQDEIVKDGFLWTVKGESVMVRNLLIFDFLD